jgi:two-component system chemotaxis response regulator CheY
MQRYLIIEDDEMSRIMLQEFLAKFALCDVADNGLEGLILFENALLSGNPYSLMCVDLIMPEMNGLAFIRKVRDLEQAKGLDNESRSKIFVISSSDSTWDKADLLLDNLCDDYIVKPFNRSSLMANLYKNDLVYRSVE